MKKRCAFICNTNNPDMVEYFNRKVSGLNDDAIFLATYDVAKKNNLVASSFSRKNTFSLFLVLDFIYSFYLVFYLLFKGAKVVIFDTAHISNIPIALLLKFFRIKMVFTIHDWHPHEGGQSRNVIVYNFVVKKILADNVIVFSSVEFNKPVWKFTLSGYDWRGSSNFKGKSPRFLFFGRIEPYKGLFNLIEVAKYLRIHRPDAVITVAGRGNDRAIKELSLLSNVEIKNYFIDDFELDELISESSCILLPYTSATQSGVIVHSYSYGKPVVAFNVGALASYIEDGRTGILCEPNDVLAFAKAAIKIYEKQEFFNKFVEDAFKNKYDSHSMIRQYKELIVDLIEG